MTLEPGGCKWIGGRVDCSIGIWLLAGWLAGSLVAIGPLLSNGPLI